MTGALPLSGAPARSEFGGLGRNGRVDVAVIQSGEVPLTVPLCAAALSVGMAMDMTMGAA